MISKVNFLSSWFLDPGAVTEAPLAGLGNTPVVSHGLPTLIGMDMCGANFIKNDVASSTVILGLIDLP